MICEVCGAKKDSELMFELHHIVKHFQRTLKKAIREFFDVDSTS